MRWSTATTILRIGVKSTAIDVRPLRLARGRVLPAHGRWLAFCYAFWLAQLIRWSSVGIMEQLDLRSISNALHALGPEMPASEPLLRATALGRHYFLVRC